MGEISNKKILFLQPIVSHYRKSVVEEISNKLPNAIFWGTKDFLNVEPMADSSNVTNDLEVYTFRVLGYTFWWYKSLYKKIRQGNFDSVVISGINPLLVNFNLIFILLSVFGHKQVYWWSQGKKVKQGFIGRIIRRFLYNLSTGVFVYSDGAKKNLKAIGVHEEKLIVVNNALNKNDYGFFNYSLKEHKNSESFNIVYSGRLSARKKVILLLKALKVIKIKHDLDIKTVIIGGGEEGENLKEYCRSNDLFFVEFVGEKYDTDAHPYLLKGSVLACPGAVGLSIIHGFSFGLPILTGKNDPMHSTELELLELGINGDYFEYEDEVSFAEKILEWRSIIEKDQNKIIDQCVESIMEKGYFPDQVAHKIVTTLIK